MVEIIGQVIWPLRNYFLYWPLVQDVAAWNYIILFIGS